MQKNSHNPDVLNCLANLSSDEVFTPPKIVNEILDLLPERLFKDKNSTFLDPCTKSGVFLREIVKRLLVGLADAFENENELITHIFKNQIYGIATTELTSLVSRRTVYCSKHANSKYSVASCFSTKQGNIIFTRAEHLWERSKCKFCGISEASSSRGKELENYAYGFIHNSEPEKIFDMRFDVVVGNPPYQMSDGGFGRSAKPIYNKFVEQAKRLNPHHLVMIIPSRWFAGGKGLDSFRESMLNDSKIKKIVDFPDARDCFPGVDIAGGVCYFHWDRDFSGTTEIVNSWRGNIQRSIRPLNEFDTFVRFGLAAKIIKKVRTLSEPTMDSTVSSRKPFGLSTNVRPCTNGDLQLFWRGGGVGQFPRSSVDNGLHLVPKWKVLTSKVSYDHAGQPNSDGMRRVLSKILLAPPNTVCTETYVVAGSFVNKPEAESLRDYLKLKFTRFLIAQRSFSQDITKDRFSFVPVLDWRKRYSDAELYKKYELDTEEINFIENTIMVMN